MSPPNFHHLLLLLLIFFTTASSSPLSTIAISHIGNKTLVCALILSSSPNNFDLNCTSFPNGTTHQYPSGAVPYTAIAAGDGFLCALTTPRSSDISTMRWWDFANNPHNNTIPDPKRVYRGPALADLSAGDSHVCGLTADSRDVSCWRWPELSVPQGLELSDVAVGSSFVCGLLAGGEIRCFGCGDDAGLVGHEPQGNFTAVAAGTSHACGLSCEGELVCWGQGAPEIDGNVPPPPPVVIAMALGTNRTCVLSVNGTVRCWGANTELPGDVVSAQFVSIQARGDSFCGVLMANYSLVCWGSERFRANHVVFKLVLPGACSPHCPCGVIAGTGVLCADGASVCRSCPPRPQSASPTQNSPPVVTDPISGSNTRRRLIFIVLGSVGLLVGFIAASAAFFYLRIRLKNGRIHDSVRMRPSIRPVEREPPMESNYGQLLGKVHSRTVEEFPMKLLLAITGGFSEADKIGSGSFGSVYRATLTDGRVVAIKRAESFSSASTSRARSPYIGQNRRRDRESAFCAELALLSNVNHKNLVRLLGYSNEGSERVLVYEFMTNGTLHDLLHKPVESPLSSWAGRIRVALDAARGIEYLHTYAVPQIIHRDIKSSNILLDEHWNAKVSDFGLSLLSDSSSNAQLRAAGTVGYMDPEYYRLQRLTAKSDVYSFGVVLLEILSGCKVIQWYEEDGSPKNVVEFAVPYIEADDIHRVLDPRLPPPTPIEIEAVAYVAYLAVDCVHLEGRRRPTMTEIVDVLERALAAISGMSLTSASRRSGSQRS